MKPASLLQSPHENNVSWSSADPMRGGVSRAGKRAVGIMILCDTTLERWAMRERSKSTTAKRRPASPHRSPPYRTFLQDEITWQTLLEMLPAGGARNALDCALWDLCAKQTGVPAWRTTGLAALKLVMTDFTLGLGDEATTRRKARSARQYPLLKLEVDASRHMDVVRMVRQEHPDARLIVDANQSWSLALLKELLPHLHEAGVELIEQPLPRGDDAELDGLHSPVALAADESCSDRSSLARLVGRYQYINIKLDKCVGLTEALALAAQASAMGFGLMVGNMCGSSLAMAPAFLIAQQCRYVDLDGPLLQLKDRATPMVYSDAMVQPPSAALWG